MGVSRTCRETLGDYEKLQAILAFIIKFPYTRALKKTRLRLCHTITMMIIAKSVQSHCETLIQTDYYFDVFLKLHLHGDNLVDLVSRY